MTLAIVVMGIIAIVLYNRGYSTEKMLPYVLIGGAAVFVLPNLLGGLIALPFKIIGAVFGTVGGLIGLVFGLVGGLIGLVFGIVGIVLGTVFLLIVPAAIVLVLVKVLT